MSKEDKPIEDLVRFVFEVEARTAAYTKTWMDTLQGKVKLRQYDHLVRTS